MAKEGKKITDYCDYVNTLDNTPYDVDKDYVYGKYQFSDEEIDYYDKIDLKIKNYSNSEKFKNEINKIALWKINRFIDFKDPEEAKKELIKLIDEYDKPDHGNLKKEIEEIAETKGKLNLPKNNVYCVLNDYLDREKVKGIRLAMLSTILRFYMPEVFPIIDVRAYRSSWALYYKKNPNEYEKYYGKNEADKLKPRPITESNRVQEYCRYIQRCQTLISMIDNPKIKTMEDIDKYLYGIDDKGNWNIDSSLIR